MAKFDFESLTIEEVESIELISGKSIDSVLDEGEFKGKALKAIIYTVNKRDNASYTLEMAAKVSFKDAMELFKADESDPKDLS